MRVRFAPSPTGYLHLGGARTALYNWLYARHHGGTFLLRIEDTDRERSTEASERAILDALEWLGITWDEPAVRQSERHAEHLAAARRLEAEGNAYRCYCTPQRLEALREAQRQRGENPRYDRHCLGRPAPSPDAPYVLRFRTPTEGTTTLDDLVKGEVTVANEELDDLIIVRSDGTPTYNFVVVCDDVDMAITHVLRGDDHLSNTFRQLHIYQGLGHRPPRFGHLPLIKGLSKRIGSASVQAYREQGYLAEAVVNYIARLGWGSGDDEILSLDELVQKFDVDGVNKAPASFDPDKFTWVNQHYLKALPVATVAERLVPFLERRFGSPPALDARLEELVGALRERAKTLADMAEQAAFAFEAPAAYDAAAVAKWIGPGSSEALAAVADGLERLDPFTVADIEAVVRGAAEARQVGLGKVAQPIRICLTGSSASPSLFEVIHVVGREEAVRRLRVGIERLSQAA